MDQISSKIRQYARDAVMLRRAIHCKPELARQEVFTTQFIKKKLTEYGIPLAQDIMLPSGAVAILEGDLPGKTLLLRADIDALPIQEASGLPFSSQHAGICHCCGHDIHTAAMLLCARVLAEIRELLCGRVIFLFQPAEETGEGALSVLNSGLFERYKPDLVIGAHCWPDLSSGTIGLRTGGFMASADTFRLQVKGKGGHGAHPHKGIDPIVAASYLVTQLQTVVSRSVAPLDSAAISIGKFTAGTAANVIPNQAVLEGTIRTINNKTRSLVEQRMREIASHCCEAMGAECQMEYQRGIPALICHSDAVNALEAAAIKQLGHECVHYLEQPSMGSEDFAYYLEQVPGAMFRIGTASETPASHLPLHNAGILFDEQAIPTGAAVMCQLARDYLKNT